MIPIRLTGAAPGTDLGTAMIQRGAQSASVAVPSYRLPATFNGVPRITSSQFTTASEWTIDTSMLTGITSYRWQCTCQMPMFFADTPTMNAADIAAYVMAMDGMHGSEGVMNHSGHSHGQSHFKAIKVVIECDQGTVESIPFMPYLTHGMASHDADDARVLAAATQHKATHIAVQDGPWNAASTWHNGRVPRFGARVLIPCKINVLYDNQTVGVRLDWIRVDGTLTVDLTKSVTFLFENLFITRGGALIDGTGAGRRPSGTSSDYIVSSLSYQNGAFVPTALDFEGDDDNLIGRGIVNQGRRSMWGAFKTPWLRAASGSVINAGATSFTLADAPIGWQVGDTIAIAGTGTNAAVKETEELTVTAIDGALISFTPALEFNHKCSNPLVTRTDLQPPVANLNRNIKIRSENPDVARHMRGHTMDMHIDCRQDIWDVEHVDLGRTFKSQDFSVFENIVGRQDGPDFWYTDSGGSITSTAMQASSNVKSRYPIHNHKCGFGKPIKDIVNGCVVRGSIGWAMTHHDCEAFYVSNVVTDFVAGMIGEEGSETGDWLDNCIMGAKVKDPTGSIKTGESIANQGLNGNFAKFGEAFYMRGRAMFVNGNIAADASWGYVFYHRLNADPNQVSTSTNLIRSTLDLKDLQAFRSHTAMRNSDYPILGVNSNEAMGMSRGGIFVTKGDPKHSHGWNINFKNFKCWNMPTGVFLEYIAQYAVTDLDAVNCSNAGIEVGTNNAQVAVVRPKTERCGVGVKFDNSGENFPDTGFNATVNPKYFLVAHNSISDGTPAQYLNSAASVTKVLGTDPTPVEPSTNLPFKLANWDGGINNSTSISGSVSGVLTATGGLSMAIPMTAGGSGHPRNQAEQGTIYPAILRDNVTNFGYWLVGGVPYAIDPFYWADPITGVPLKSMHGIQMTGGLGGFANNGTYTKHASAPVVSPASLSLSAGGTGTIDILALASHPNGATMYVDPSFESGTLTRVTDITDGVVTCRAETRYTGSDKVILWVADLVGTDVTGRKVAGNFTRVDLNITIS